MATKPEYKITDIKITPDGANFRVIVQSDFVVDEFGDPKDEMYQFPIKELNNETKWKGRIDSIMLKRAIDEEEEDFLDTTTPEGGFVSLTVADKRLNRISRIKTARESFIGTHDLAEKVEKIKEVRYLEAEAKAKIDTEPLATVSAAADKNKEVDKEA